jgi:hypothetical protein
MLLIESITLKRLDSNLVNSKEFYIQSPKEAPRGGKRIEPTGQCLQGG